jgi:uncharacterized protein (TIGR02266 family)
MNRDNGEFDARRSRRIEAAFRVRYRSVDDLVDALTQDLSRGGTFIRTPRGLPIDAVVRVNLELPDGGGDVALVCRVAFVRGPEEAAARQKPAGMGLEFLDLDADRLEQLTTFMTQQAHARAAIATATAAAAAAAIATAARLPARKRLDVVVVDDDAGARTPIARALRQRGDDVREAEDGLDALSLCVKQTPDLIVSDVQMPRMDGWQLLRMLRARPSLGRVPVILVTTLADDEARLRGYRLGVDDYIAKPVREDEFLMRADRLLARAHSPAPPEHGLRGGLEHVSLPSLLSFLAMEHKTGVLLLVGAAEARIHLRGGQPLRVEIDDVAVKDAEDPALFALLDWQTGQFELAAQAVVCADELGTTVTALLLEHARRTDEAAR